MAAILSRGRWVLKHSTVICLHRVVDDLCENVIMAYDVLYVS